MLRYMNLKYLKNIFTQKNTKTDTNAMSTPYQEEVHKLERRLPHLEREGEKEGSRDALADDLSELPSTLKHWQHLCKKVQNFVRGYFEQRIIRVQEELNYLQQQEQQLTDPTRAQDQSELRNDYHLRQQKKELRIVKKQTKAQKKILEQELVWSEKELHQYLAEKTIMRRQREALPIGRYFDYTGVYVIFLGLIGAVELPPTYAAVLDSGMFDNGLGLLLGLGTVLLMLVSAHLTGEGISKANHYVTVGGVITFLMLLGMITLLRDADIRYLSVSIAVYFIGVIASFYRSQNRTFFLCEKNIRVAKHRIRVIKDKLENLEPERLQKNKAIEATYYDKIMGEKTAKKESRSTLEGKIKTRSIELETLKQQLADEERAIDNLWIRGCHIYIENYQKVRKRTGDRGSAFLDSYTPQPLLFSYTSEVDKQDSPTYHPSKIATILLFIMSFIFSSCSVFLPEPLSKEVTIVIDKTDSVFIDGGEVVDYLFENMNLDEDKTSHIQVNIGTITDRFIEPIVHINLPAGKGFMMRNEKARQEAITAFKHEVKTTLESMTQLIPSLPYTQLYYPLCCEYLSALANSSADIKTLLLYSNLIHHTKDLSFYQYRRKPEGLLNDYESVLQQLEKSCLLPDLQGVDIRVIHFPQKQEDALFVTVKSFWEKYFTDRNIQNITFATHL